MPRSRRAVARVLVACAVALAPAACVTQEGPAAAERLPASAPLDERLTSLRAAASAAPDDVEAQLALASAELQAAAAGGDPDAYERARSAVAAAREAAPGDPRVDVVDGALSLSLHRFDDALRLGEAAVAALPRNPAALGVLVDAQVELGRYDEAAGTLQRMLDVRPALPALARTSYLRQLGGDLPGAVDAMRAAVQAGSGDPVEVGVVSGLLGTLLLQAGDLPGARAAADDAVALAPDHVEAAVLHARTTAASGDPDAALAELEEVVARYPAPVATTWLADLRARTGDTAGAAEAERLVEGTARLQEAAGSVVDLELSLLLADAGDADAALRRARAAHEARPDNVFTDDALGWALHTAGDDAEAVRQVDAALRRGTADPLLHFHAAVVRDAAGDAQGARDALEALSASPWFSFRHGPEAAELAARYGVEAPPAWTDLSSGAPASGVPASGVPADAGT